MNSSEKNWQDFANSHEYSVLDEAVSAFDEARGALYGQTALIMHGEGGDSQIAAENKLEESMVYTANCFSAAALTIAAHTPDRDDAVELIAKLYETDETDRLNLLKTLRPDGNYSTIDQENLRQGIAQTLEEESDEEDQHDIFEHMYGHACTFGINECIDEAPDNNAETEAARQQARNKLIKRTVGDVAKMAGAALIAVALTSRRKK